MSAPDVTLAVRREGARVVVVANVEHPGRVADLPEGEWADFGFPVEDVAALELLRRGGMALPAPLSDACTVAGGSAAECRAFRVGAETRPGLDLSVAIDSVERGVLDDQVSALVCIR